LSTHVIATIAVILVAGARADAKPRIVVKTEFGPGALNLHKRIGADLTGDHIQKTPEEFITEQFIAAVAPLKMFEFRSAATAQSQHKVLIVIDAEQSTPWPLGDVQLTLAIEGQTFQLPFCMRAACFGDCIPPSFTLASWYRAKFESVLKQWPAGFLKNIPLSTAARYERGHIMVQADIAEFGQSPTGPPTAFFELINGSTQRQFVFCRAHDGLAEGDDHGTQAQANCSAGPVQPSLVLPGAGTITLLKALL
jgi:hypothetical protein